MPFENVRGFVHLQRFEHSKNLCLTLVSEHTEGFRMNGTLVFAHEAPDEPGRGTPCEPEGESK